MLEQNMSLRIWNTGPKCNGHIIVATIIEIPVAKFFMLQNSILLELFDFYNKMQSIIPLLRQNTPVGEYIWDFINRK